MRGSCVSVSPRLHAIGILRLMYLYTLPCAAPPVTDENQRQIVVIAKRLRFRLSISSSLHVLNWRSCRRRSSHSSVWLRSFAPVARYRSPVASPRLRPPHLAARFRHFTQAVADQRDQLPLRRAAREIQQPEGSSLWSRERRQQIDRFHQPRGSRDSAARPQHQAALRRPLMKIAHESPAPAAPAYLDRHVRTPALDANRILRRCLYRHP